MTIQTIVADNLNPPETITPPIWCTSITIVEADGLATSDFLIRAPLNSSPACRVAAGQQLRLQSGPDHPFSPYQPALYLETASGTLNFTVIYA
jgi:hypothetical protein